MDHFNATIQNGSLVSTRRGLQITKTKHQGTRFVNSFAGPNSQPAKSKRDGFAIVDLSKPLETRFKFVTPKEGKKSTSTIKEKSSSPPSTSQDKEDEESRRQSKKLIVRRKTTGNPANGSSAALAMAQAWAKAEQPSIGSWRPKVWKTHSGFNHFGFDVKEKSRSLLHVYFAVVPNMMYPLEEILEFNPVRLNSFFERVHRDLVIMHCVVMAASYVEIIARGERFSNDASFYLSRVCNTVNRRLQNNDHLIEPSVLECVVAMAICGVSGNSCRSPTKTLQFTDGLPVFYWAA